MPIKLQNVESIAPNSTGDIVMVPIGGGNGVMTVSDTNRVGILTSTPQVTFDVQGSNVNIAGLGGILAVARVKGAGNDGASLVIESDPGTYSAIQFAVGNIFDASIYQLGDNKLRLYGGQNVALGPLLAEESTYPIRYPVHLMASILSPAPSIAYQSSDASVGLNLNLGTELVFGAFSPTGGWMQYRTIGGIVANSSFSINPAGGNVGIGTQNPQAALDVVGDIHCTNRMVAGTVTIQNLPATDPGPGTKQLWYDPADGNRVKFAV